MNCPTKNAANILVVDDDLVNLQVVTGALARAGFATVSANTGESAMDCLKEEQFDAVVTDVQMPHMSGIELLQNISARFPQLPVILMSAQIEEHVREAASIWGARALFEKPVNRADLIQTIRLHLQRPAGFDCEFASSGWSATSDKIQP